MPVARDNIQQLSFILWTEQYSPFGVMLLPSEECVITELLLRGENS